MNEYAYSPTPPPDPDDPGARDRKRVYIVLGAFAGAVVLFGGLFGAIAFYLYSQTETTEARESDLVAQVTAGDLVEYFDGLEVDPGCERATRTHHWDSTIDVDYSYEHPDPDWPLSLHSGVNIKASEKEAKEAFILLVAGSMAGFAIGSEEGVVKRKDNEFFSAGDSSRHYFILGDEGGIGHMVFVRIGKRIMTMFLTGACFEEKEMLAELLAPKLEALPTFDPK